jgi:hypothetical protein
MGKERTLIIKRGNPDRRRHNILFMDLFLIKEQGKITKKAADKEIDSLKFQELKYINRAIT